MIDNLYKIVKYPDKVYKNKASKRGGYCLVKRIRNLDYLCSIEAIKMFCDGVELEEVQIATAFRLRDSNYIKKYTLLWSWEDGDPHRSVLDTPKGTTHAPQ